MSEPTKLLGEVVEERLDELGMSARELARKMGMTQTPIHYWIRGDKPPNVKQMEEMARYLEIPPETFIEYRLEVARERLNWKAPKNGREPRRVRVKRLREAVSELEALDPATLDRGPDQKD